MIFLSKNNDNTYLLTTSSFRKEFSSIEEAAPVLNNIGISDDSIDRALCLMFAFDDLVSVKFNSKGMPIEPGSLIENWDEDRE